MEAVESTITGPEAQPVRASGRWRDVGVDHLKLALTIGVIITHAVVTYADAGDWYYQERNLGDVVGALVVVPASIGLLFAMSLFFFVAGVFTPTALASKGSGRFVAERALRLGLPVVAYIVVVSPFVNGLVAYGVDGRHGSLVAYWSHQVARLDPGPLWFLAVLLLFSATHAAVGALHGVGRRPVRISARLLASLGLFVAVVSFVVRLRFGMDTHQVLSSHLSQWPGYGALFWLGTAVGPSAVALPERLRRACGWAAVAAITALPLLMAAGGAFADGADESAFAGGWHWQALGTAVVEAALVVTIGPWLVAWSARRWSRTGPWSRRLSGAAYGAFLVQAPILVGVAVLLRRLGAAPELKLLVLAIAAVAGSFGVSLAWHAGRRDVHPGTNDPGTNGPVPPDPCCVR